jgi:sugar lactone lactonase YvrE
VDGCDGDFLAPRDVAVNSAGQIYVVEGDNDRVQRFDNDGNFQMKWGTNGNGNGEFDRPAGVAVDASGNVYVVEFYNHRIQKFDSDGVFINKWGSLGSGDYEFQYPVAVTVNSAGNVYVSDWVNNRVMRYTHFGVYLGEWGSFCDTSVDGVDGCDGDFYGPYGLAVDSSFNVYVADSQNNRIQKFNSIGSSLLAKWGEHCEVETSGVDACDGDFNYPFGVAVDAAGNVFVSDKNNYRIQKFDSDGNFLEKWGTYGSDPGEFGSAYGLEFDPWGYLFIADGSFDRVWKYAPPPLNFFVGEPEALASVRR